MRKIITMKTTKLLLREKWRKNGASAKKQKQDLIKKELYYFNRQRNFV